VQAAGGRGSGWQGVSAGSLHPRCTTGRQVGLGGADRRAGSCLLERSPRCWWVCWGWRPPWEVAARAAGPSSSSSIQTVHTASIALFYGQGGSHIVVSTVVGGCSGAQALVVAAGDYVAAVASTASLVGVVALPAGAKEAAVTEPARSGSSGSQPGQRQGGSTEPAA